MKKILALVLVICMVLGLVACGNKPADKNPTTAPTSGTTPTTGKTSFKGKTLQIYGNGSETSYTDYTKFGKNYLWMMRAAMDEWATANEVTLKFCGGYDQNVILAAMASGEKPDIIFATNYFPSTANYGMVAPWTEEEYNTMVEAVGNKQWLDMLEYKTKSYGIVLPWTGTMMIYFNQSMFEKYDVKSPLDYFNEGNWTWKNFETVLKEMTKDLDADGTKDTYGCNSETWGRMLNPMAMNDKGEVLNLIDEAYMHDFFQMKYNSYAVDFTTGGGKITSNVTYPMAAMQLSDCEPYNFEHMFQYIKNGDALIAVPAPEWESADGKRQTWRQLTQACAHIASSCDEREAAFDLLVYLMKCGLKYMSDFSFGAVKCDHAGMQGTSELSKQWKAAFAEQMAAREEKLATLEGLYDADHMKKVMEYFDKIGGWHAFTTYGGITSLLGYSEITKMPPASSIPAVKEKHQAALDKYNDLYVFE